MPAGYNALYAYYVVVGTSSTASNFINGYSATAFGPEDNVTYAQAIKMVVAALGYTTLAEGQGGWPSGYLKYGYQLGIATLSGVGNDDQLNRAQVAQIIDNALKCPICVSNGYSYNALGQQVPNTLIKDGTGDLDDTKDGYENLLNYAHDAYLVYGRITGTFKSGDSVDVDQVRYQVEKSDNWYGNDDRSVKADKDYPDEYTEAVYKGSVQNADDYLFTYSEAIIQKDRNDELTLISLSPFGASDKIELDASDYNEIKPTSSDYQLKMYKDANQSKSDTYKLDKEAKVYVNGRLIDGDIEDLFNGDYVDGNKVGKITLIDAPDVAKSSTDGKYDYVMISYYLDGIVSEVVYKSDEAIIYLDKYDDRLNSRSGKITLDLDNDDMDYNFILNGEEISVNDIQEDDVLSIAYNVEDGINDTTFFTFIVSRDTVEGKITSVSQDDDYLDREYVLDNGETYKLAFSKVDKPESGTSYTMYLDAFGKIVKIDKLMTSTKYAILENVYMGTGNEPKAIIISGTGNKIAFDLKSSDNDAEFKKLRDVLMGEKGHYEDSITLSDRVPVQNRVIEYKILTTGELKMQGTSAVTPEEVNGEYKISSSSSKIGSTKISDTITQIVDIDGYDNTLSETRDAISVSELTAGSDYTGFAYGGDSSDKIFQFVLIDSGIGGYNVNNSWAVFKQKIDVDTDNGQSKAIEAYVGGELTQILAENVDDDTLDAMHVGDVFFYKLDNENQIDDSDGIRMVTRTSGLSYRELFADALEYGLDIVDAKTAAAFNSGNFTRSNVDDCYLIGGVLVDVDGRDISIANVNNVKNTSASEVSLKEFPIDKVKDYTLDDEAKVYVYDYSQKTTRNRLTTGAIGSVRSSSFDRWSYQDNDSDSGIVDFYKELDAITYTDPEDLSKGSIKNDRYGNVNFAIAKVVDKEITEILVIIPDDETGN